MKLVYTDVAIADLKRLRTFIETHDPSAAARVAAELVEKIRRLTDFPHLDAPVPLAPDPDSIRDMVFGHYVVRYSVHPSVVIVLRIWHGREGER
ncbi:MAG: type II toxin-antitoxin system RelE/ParE family toxin [Alcanivorax sp.]|nr:type II toxin-antitoxin system RelE/ParE family toxin [Alcanivorax sp.]